MRVSIYAGSFAFTLFSTCLNLASLNRLDWIVYKAPPHVGIVLRTLWGLFTTCNYGVDGKRQCRPFPIEGTDCSRPQDLPGGASWHKPFTFCDYYRTAGYTAQLAAVFGVAALIAHIIIVARGRHFRNHGWKVLSGFILANAVCQLITTSFMVHLLRTTDRFTPGARLSKAFILSQISTGTDIILFGCLLAAGVIHARNGSPDGYKEIPTTPRSRRRWEDEDDEQSEI